MFTTVVLLALAIPCLGNQRYAPQLNATGAQGVDECPDGGPPPSGWRKCPAKTKCCTCQAEEGWTTGGCVPENDNCCGSASCPNLHDVKCCANFVTTGNGNYFQCYNTTEYKCSRSGPLPITRRPVKGGVGPLLGCN